MPLARVRGQPVDALVDHANGRRGRLCVLGTLAFIVTLAFGLLIAPLAVDAEQPAKVPRIGYLALIGSRLAAERVWDTFQKSLRELAWIEGQNLVIEYRSAEGNVDRLPDLAAELVRLNVALIVTICGPQIATIRRASRTIPIVVAACADMVGGRFVASLARPFQDQGKPHSLHAAEMKFLGLWYQ